MNRKTITTSKARNPCWYLSTKVVEDEEARNTLMQESSTLRVSTTTSQYQ